MKPIIMSVILFCLPVHLWCMTLTKDEQFEKLKKQAGDIDLRLSKMSLAEFQQEDIVLKDILLGTATLQNNKSLVEMLLLDNTITIDNESGAFWYAIIHGRTDILELLLQRYTGNINEKNNQGKIPLLQAIRCGKPTVVEILLARGADINKMRDGKTPLHEAVSSYDNIKTIRTLLDNGADITARDSEGKTALEIAKSRYDKKAVALLKQAEQKTQSRSCMVM